MSDGAATAVIVLSLVFAGWCGVTVIRDRVIGVSHLIGTAILEIALLVMAVATIVALAGGDRPAGELATFVGYLVGSVIAPPVGLGLAMAERTRWGAAVLGVICLVLPVLVVRLQQVWDGASV